MTVGETSGVTIEEAQKYAGDDREELNMVFQFEHVEIGGGDYGKWTTERYDFFKVIMKMMENFGTEVIYVRGNHDDFLLAGVGRKLGLTKRFTGAWMLRLKNPGKRRELLLPTSTSTTS